MLIAEELHLLESFVKAPGDYNLSNKMIIEDYYPLYKKDYKIIICGSLAFCMIQYNL